MDDIRRRTVLRLPPVAVVRVIPSAILVAAAWAMAWAEHGSILAGDWLPYAVLGALVLAVVLFSRTAVVPDRLPLVGIGLLAGLALWAGISESWSPVPSLARDEALLTAFYAVALAVPLLTLRTPVDRLAATAVLVVGMGTLAVATALKLAGADSPLELYDTGRLSYPISYANAQAGIFLIAFWPAITLAARRRTHLVLRGLAIGSAVVLLGGWLAAQSKGGIIALVVSTIVFFAVCPARLRVLVPTLIPAVIVAAAFVPLTEPFRAESDAATASAISDTGVTLLVIAAVGTIAGLVYATIDSRIKVSRQAHRVAERVALAGLVAGVAAVVLSFFLAAPHPGRFFERQWHSFKRLPSKEQTSTHLLTLGSNRYDFWRVSLSEFRDHPITGVGARGFGPVYLQKRDSPETPARAHSIFVEVLMEQGLVGFVLLIGAVGLPLYVVARRAARRRVPAAAAFAGGVYWLTHAGVDWTWTFPAAGVPFFLLLGIGASSDEERRLRRRQATPLAVIAVALAALAFMPVWISAKLTNRAADDGSLGDIRWARRLDPLSTEPLVVKAGLATTVRVRIDALEEAIGIEPRSTALQYLLGLAYLAGGRRTDAVRALEEAHRLDPRDPFIDDALRLARERAVASGR